MTAQEAIEGLEYLISGDCTDNQQAFIKEIEIAISALEKQIPKKPTEKEVIGASMTGYKYKGQCPKCSSTVSQYTGNHCPKCGQVLDWSENNG